MADGTSDHDEAGGDASGFLCGVCDTPLPAGADHCVSCGTPVVWLDDAPGPDDATPPPTAVTVGDEPAAATDRPIRPAAPAAAAAPTTATPINARPNTSAPADSRSTSDGANGSTSSTSSSKGEHTTLLIGIGVIAVALVVAGIIIVTGGKKDDTKTAAAAVTATTTTPTTPPTTAGKVTTTKAPPTTKATATTKAPPTTKDTPTTKAPTTSALDTKAAFCAASKTYTVTDVLTLGVNAVSDPDGQLAAYDSFLTNAPDDLKDPITQMGSLTKKSVEKVKSGEIKSPQELQQWIASEPPDDVIHWIAAQQLVVPRLAQICL